MITYPIQFYTKGLAKCGIQGTWSVDSEQHSLQISVPREFEGPGGALSPEDLFAQALTNCFVATFKVMAEHSKLTFESLQVDGQLTVDRDDTKKPVMKAFHLKIKLYGPDHSERATRLVSKAMDSGFILNSVRTAVTHELEII